MVLNRPAVPFVWLIAAPSLLFAVDVGVVSVGTDADEAVLVTLAE
jgi:hypothetical protein